MTEKEIQEPIRLQPKIHINICTHRAMNPFFVNSMFYMLDYMNKTGLNFEINSHTGVSNIVGGRQNRVTEALNSSCTHMFMIDDDMVFSMDIVHKLLHEANKLTVNGVKKIAMGVNPCRKSPTGLFYTAKELDSDNFVKSKGKSGVVEVSKCGLGAFLIETALLREISEPHFEVPYAKNHSLYKNAQKMRDLLMMEVLDDARRDAVLKDIEDTKIHKEEHLGEDFYFCEKLRDHGVRIFIDQDISQTMGHAGEFIYTYSSYQNEKDGHDQME